MKINDSVFDSYPVLRTKRLTLRQISASDAEAIFTMRSNKILNKFIARDPMSSPKDAAGLVQKTNKAFTDKTGIGWAGLLRENGTIIGSCGFNSIDYPNLRGELGGELAPDFWGKNIAIEAANAVVTFGFQRMNLQSIDAKVSPQNRGAIFLLESIGFKKEAHFTNRIYFKGRFSDMAVYTAHKSLFKEQI
ncbi:MAG: ribosomal-protein-alanine N-acetyltransferase [bacterium]|jgi:ribosomal-protein-alanine N-acetyltransferase